MGGNMRSRGVSSHRSNKRSKRGNKLSKRISKRLSKRRVKRSNKRSNRRLNKRSNRRLNRKSFKRVSKRMRNNRRSFRRRGGAPGDDDDKPNVAHLAAEWHTSVRLRCLGFQELDFDPKTRNPLKSMFGFGFRTKEVHYLIRVVTKNPESNSKEDYFIRRRWSDIKVFIQWLDNFINETRNSEIEGKREYYRQYDASETKKYADAILDDVYREPSQRQGILDEYLLALSNYNNIYDPHKQIGKRIVNRRGMWQRDLVMFQGILPREETLPLDLSIKFNLGQVARLPENRVPELLEIYKQENPTQAEPTSSSMRSRKK